MFWGLRSSIGQITNKVWQSFSLEELHGAFVLFRSLTSIEGSQVAAFAGFGILLA
jgi:hypothetical protein